MRLFLLTALTMVAFAANSVLNRLALAEAEAGPASFALFRVATGAVALWLMVRARGGGLPSAATGRLTGTLSLFVYLMGFSFAYISLDAGAGALILFGGVQITMFAGGLLGGERPPALRWVGAAVAAGGLVWLLWPGAAGQPDLWGAALMSAAAVGWGIYSLAGRGAGDPLAATAANFVLATPLCLIAWLFLSDTIDAYGAALATVSGVVTSGLGYALWYTVLPRLQPSVAALAQLTVPVIALAGGIAFLGEALTARFALATVLVLGGVAIGVLARRR